MPDVNNAIVISLVPLALGFTAYFVLHSLLASLRLKRVVQKRWPELMPAYRLTYNAVSVILLLPLLWWMQQHPGPLIWQWRGGFWWLMNGLALLAIGGFLWSLRSYDGMVFLGWRQWRDRHRTSNDPERLHISTLHRFVRHPWYFFLLVLMWTREIHLAQLCVYGLVTVYLVVGSWQEERKLIVQYGEAYRVYRSKVPALIPLPWRWLDIGEAKALQQSAQQQE